MIQTNDGKDHDVAFLPDDPFNNFLKQKWPDLLLGE